MRPNFDPDRRDEIEARILRLRRDGLSLERICALPGFPTRPTLLKWRRESPELDRRLSQGREEHRRTAPRYPFDPDVAARLIERVRFREPLGGLLREPGMPHRRALTAWKRDHPAFAAELAAAKDIADYHRRRYGRRCSTRRPYDEPTADRIILAVVKGATLPQLHRDPAMPNRLALRRWRRTHPEFDGALRAAMCAGHRARGRARRNAACTPALTEAIENHIVAGHSLASLGRRRDMPSLTSLYQWVRERPDFARAVTAACEFRDWLIADDAIEASKLGGIGPGSRAAALSQRLGQLNPHPGERRRNRSER